MFTISHEIGTNTEHFELSLTMKCLGFVIFITGVVKRYSQYSIDGDINIEVSFSEGSLAIGIQSIQVYITSNVTFRNLF